MDTSNERLFAGVNHAAQTQIMTHCIILPLPTRKRTSHVQYRSMPLRRNQVRNRERTRNDGHLPLQELSTPQAGSAFSTLGGVSKAEFALTAGTPKLYEDTDTASGNPVQRYFCGNCGSPIYSAISAQPDTIYLKTGTLDDTSNFEPQFQAWCDSKQNWVTLDEGVPAMATQ